MDESLARRLLGMAALFFKLGLIGFGGPAAHIAMIEEETVTRRGWLTRNHFLDLVGATNLIPGPNSTEMAIHVGYVRAGWPGLLVAGASFILPAALITGSLAYLYLRFGSLPEVVPFLVGIQPAVIAVISGALLRLGRAAIKGPRLLVVGAAVAGAALLGANEVIALLAGGVGGMLWQRAVETRGRVAALVPWPLLLLQAPHAPAAAVPSLWEIALFFLKIGSVLYGSGYVLVAFLEGGLVHDYGWLTQQQLLDAIAVGQFTPGPVLTTATFVGYLLAGTPGAIVATLGIFAPSFLFVAILNPLVPRLRQSPWPAAFLDAINASAVGLMVAVTIQIAAATLTSWQAWAIGGAAMLAVLAWQVSPAWVVAGGALAGWILAQL